MKKSTVLVAGVFLLAPVFSSAQNIPPDLPNDNVDGIFLASPMTVDLANTMPGTAIRGYLLGWDNLQQQWSDTLAIARHMHTALASGTSSSEVVWSKSTAGQLDPVYRTEIFNSPDWNGQPGLTPDSAVFYDWQANTGAWTRRKKITYQSLAGQVAERATTLGNHAQPDTLEKIYTDSVWDHLVKLRLLFVPGQGDYLPLDSTVYVYYNGLCQSFGVYNLQDGSNQPLRRHKFKYFGDAQNYTMETDFWSDSLNFWRARYKFSQTFSPDEYRIFQQYDTLTTVAWQSYRRFNRLFSDDWKPHIFETEYFPGLETFPDSAYRREFYYNPGSGFLDSIVTQYKTIFGDWQPHSKWFFNDDAPVGINDDPVALSYQVQLFTLSNRVFQARLPETATPLWARVLDRSGRLILFQRSPGAFINVDLSAQPAGLYYLQVQSGKEIKSIPLAAP